MESNPDDTKQYFEGLDYPASKGDVAEAARENDAPEELIERLYSLSTPEFSSPDHVAEDLRAAPGAG